MTNCYVLFSLLIAANSKSLFVYCLFIHMVGLFVSVLYIVTISTENLCFILTLNWRSREEHCQNKCLFDLHFENHNFLITISTCVVKVVFEKSLNGSFVLHSRCILFVSLHTVLRVYSARFIKKNKYPMMK